MSSNQRKQKKTKDFGVDYTKRCWLESKQTQCKSYTMEMKETYA